MTRRILFVVPRFHTNLAGAVAALRQAGHRPTVIAARRVEGEDHSHTRPLVEGQDFDLDGLGALIERIAPDLAFVRQARPLSDSAGSRLMRRGGTRAYEYSLQPATAPSERLRSLKRRLRRLPVRRVTPCPGPPGAPRDPLATLLPWPVEIGPAPARPPGPFRVIAVGKLNQRRKHLGTVIDAMARLRADWRLTLAGSSAAMGDPALAVLTALRQRAAADPRITLRADLPFAEMAAQYRAHDACVLIADDEPLGMAPLEAMGQGCVPVIAETAGAAGYVDHGTTGLLVPPGDADALARALAEPAADPVRRSTLARAAHAAADRQLSARRFLSVIDRL